MAKKKIVRKAKRTKTKRAAKKRPAASRKNKRPAKKKMQPPRKRTEPMLEKIGEVTHYFPKVKAAAVMMLKSGLKAGENIYIKGHTTDFREKIASMQLDHEPIQSAKKGDEIGLLVKSRVRIGDSVYRI